MRQARVDLRWPLVVSGNAAMYLLEAGRQGRRPVPGWRTMRGPDWGELDVRATRPDWRLERLGTQPLGPLRYNHFALSGLHLRRTPRHLREEAPSYVLAMPQAGASRSRIDGQEIEVAPGSIYLLHGTVAAEIHPQGNYETFNLQIPAHLLQQRVSSLPKAYSAALDGSDPRADLLGRYARYVNRVARDLRDDEAALLAGQLCDLVALMLRGDERACCDDRSLAAAHKRRVLEFIAARYADEDLCADTIARCCGISERYLYKLFHDSGQSAMERLRVLRLEKAHAMLGGSALSQLPVSEIAYRNGFRSLSSFCRAFRQRYGITPGELRRTAV